MVGCATSLDIVQSLGLDDTTVQRAFESSFHDHVPVSSAIRRLVVENLQASAERIHSLSLDQSDVTLNCRVKRVGRRPIRFDGQDRIITEGIISDSSGTVPFVAWRPFPVSPGDRILLHEATVQIWNDEIAVRIDEQTSVWANSEHTHSQCSSVAIPLSAIRPGDRAVSVSACILESASRSVTGNRGCQQIRYGILTDGTRTLPYTDWMARPGLEAGSRVNLENVYVEPFDGIPTLNLSQFTTIGPARVDIQQREAIFRTSIRDAIDKGGGLHISLEGSILGLLNGSGVVDRCPHCRRITASDHCRQHGSVTPIPELRTKAILDDGTDTTTIVLGETITASIYGVGPEGAREEAQRTMHQQVVADTIADRIVGRPFRVCGTLSLDEFGGIVDVNTFRTCKSSPKSRARNILDGEDQ